MIEQREAFRNRFDRVNQLLLRRVQCLLGLLALGDVLRRAKQAEAVTIRIVFRTQLDLHPADFSIGPHPAVFNLRRRPYCDRTAARIEKGGDGTVQG